MHLPAALRFGAFVDSTFCVNGTCSRAAPTFTAPARYLYFSTLELLYHSSCCHVEYDPSVHLLVFTLIGFLPSTELRASYEEALSAANRRGVRRWLSDFGQMRAVRQADQDWLVQDFTPRLTTGIGATLRRSAIVQSADAMNQLFTESVITRTQPTRSWETRHFDSRTEALVWLYEPLPEDSF